MKKEKTQRTRKPYRFRHFSYFMPQGTIVFAYWVASPSKPTKNPDSPRETVCIDGVHCDCERLRETRIVERMSKPRLFLLINGHHYDLLDVADMLGAPIFRKDNLIGISSDVNGGSFMSSVAFTLKNSREE